MIILAYWLSLWAAAWEFQLSLMLPPPSPPPVPPPRHCAVMIDFARWKSRHRDRAA